MKTAGSSLCLLCRPKGAPAEPSHVDKLSPSSNETNGNGPTEMGSNVNDKMHDSTDALSRDEGESTEVIVVDSSFESCGAASRGGNWSAATSQSPDRSRTHSGGIRSVASADPTSRESASTVTASCKGDASAVNVAAIRRRTGGGRGVSPSPKNAAQIIHNTAELEESSFSSTDSLFWNRPCLGKKTREKADGANDDSSTVSDQLDNENESCEVVTESNSESSILQQTFPPSSENYSSNITSNAETAPTKQKKPTETSSESSHSKEWSPSNHEANDTGPTETESNIDNKVQDFVNALTLTEDTLPSRDKGERTEVIFIDSSDEIDDEHRAVPQDGGWTLSTPQSPYTSRTHSDKIRPIASDPAICGLVSTVTAPGDKGGVSVESADTSRHRNGSCRGVAPSPMSATKILNNTAQLEESSISSNDSLFWNKPRLKKTIYDKDNGPHDGSNSFCQEVVSDNTNELDNVNESCELVTDILEPSLESLTLGQTFSLSLVSAPPKITSNTTATTTKKKEPIEAPSEASHSKERSPSNHEMNGIWPTTTGPSINDKIYDLANATPFMTPEGAIQSREEGESAEIIIFDLSEEVNDEKVIQQRRSAVSRDGDWSLATPQSPDPSQIYSDDGRPVALEDPTIREAAPAVTAPRDKGDVSVESVDTSRYQIDRPRGIALLSKDGAQISNNTTQSEESSFSSTDSLFWNKVCLQKVTYSKDNDAHDVESDSKSSMLQATGLGSNSPNITSNRKTTTTKKKKCDDASSHYHCYCLRSMDSKHPYKNYVGFTTNPERRLKQHNGLIKHGGANKTRRSGRPWEFVVVVSGFPTHRMALQFEYAWQHPAKSLLVRAAIGNQAARTLQRKRGTPGQMCILRTLLELCPTLYERNHLTLNFLKAESKAVWEKAPAMPALPAAVIAENLRSIKGPVKKRTILSCPVSTADLPPAPIIPKAPVASVKLLMSLSEMEFWVTRKSQPPKSKRGSNNNNTNRNQQLTTATGVNDCTNSEIGEKQTIASNVDIQEECNDIHFDLSDNISFTKDDRDDEYDRGMRGIMIDLEDDHNEDAISEDNFASSEDSDAFLNTNNISEKGMNNHELLGIEAALENVDSTFTKLTNMVSLSQEHAGLALEIIDANARPENESQDISKYMKRGGNLHSTQADASTISSTASIPENNNEDINSAEKNPDASKVSSQKTRKDTNDVTQIRQNTCQSDEISISSNDSIWSMIGQQPTTNEEAGNTGEKGGRVVFDAVARERGCTLNINDKQDVVASDTSISSNDSIWDMLSRPFQEVSPAMSQDNSLVEQISRLNIGKVDHGQNNIVNPYGQSFADILRDSKSRSLNKSEDISIDGSAELDPLPPEVPLPVGASWKIILLMDHREFGCANNFLKKVEQKVNKHFGGQFSEICTLACADYMFVARLISEDTGQIMDERVMDMVIERKEVKDACQCLISDSKKYKPLSFFDAQM